MADEQTIYLSPEEELTSVRERLGKTEARKIILVIPPQTQLRSHVGWRLIHARVRELGIELQVICPDRQVRAVASAAGFKVSETPESPSNRPRLGGTRPGANPRGAGRSRIGGSRAGHPEGPTRRRFTPSTASRYPSSSQPEYDDESGFSDFETPSQKPSESSQLLAPPPIFEASPSSYAAPIESPGSTASSYPYSRIEEDEPQQIDEQDYRTAQQIRQSITEGRGGRYPTGKTEKRSQAASQWRDPFEYMVDDHPSVRLPEQKGSAPGSIDDLEPAIPDISDRTTASMNNDIEDLGDLGNISLPEIDMTQERTENSGRARPRSGQMQPPPRMPQLRHSPRAPRPVEQDFDDDDDLFEIHDRRTQAPAPSKNLANAPQAARPSKNLSSQPQSARPSRNLSGSGPTGGRGASANLSRGRVPSQPIPVDPDRRRGNSQPIADDPASRRPRNPTGSTARKPTSQPVGAGSSTRKPPSQALRPEAAAARGAAGSRPAYSSQRPPNRQLMPPPPASPLRQPALPRRQRRSNRGLLVAVISIVVLLLLAAGLFYFVPTAQVTVTLQSKAFSQPVQLNATTSQASGDNIVPAHMVRQVFSVSGQGTANGSARVGNAKAHGVVTFTNKSNMDLVIPSHIVIATSSGPDAINFVTTAQSLVPQNGSFPGTTIEAQETGDTGNVPEGSITVIPQSSLDAISQYNKTTITASNLTVTNQNKTDGGGATTVLAVTQDNLNALTQTLHQKIQSQVKSWLASVVHQGDFQGKLLPDVLGSTNPLPDEKLSGAPAVNQPAPSGTFTGSIVLTVNTLIAKAADVQAVAGNLVNSAAAKAKPAMTLPTHASLTFASVKTTPSNDGQSLAIAATATGNVIPLLSSQDISGKLAGKGASDAVVDLKNGTLLNGIKAKDAHIEISPSFLPSLPMLADHIQVILQASKS